VTEQIDQELTHLEHDSRIRFVSGHDFTGCKETKLMEDWSTLSIRTRLHMLRNDCDDGRFIRASGGFIRASGGLFKAL
jgi:hypothetical protein